MSDTFPAATVRAAQPRAKAGRFDRTSIALHWLTVVLIALQFATAWLGGSAGSNATTLLAVHRSMGLLVWGVVMIRLVWRWSFAQLPPFPATMPPLQQQIARLSEFLLYALMLLQPLTGIGDTLFRGRPVVLFGLHVPALLPADKPLHLVLHTLHELGANTLLVLITLHACAGLMHGLILKDGVLQRMLPWTGRDPPV
jgi:cytochrome b561